MAPYGANFRRCSAQLGSCACRLLPLQPYRVCLRRHSAGTLSCSGGAGRVCPRHISRQPVRVPVGAKFNPCRHSRACIWASSPRSFAVARATCSAKGLRERDMTIVKYRCPSCGFQIFNRRVQKCESCGGKLPQELLFSPQQIAALDAEHERSKKEREARARGIGRGSGDSGSGSSDISWDFGGGGDGGGCD